jgi:hypothetical protein
MGILRLLTAMVKEQVTSEEGTDSYKQSKTESVVEILISRLFKLNVVPVQKPDIYTLYEIPSVTHTRFPTMLARFLSIMPFLFQSIATIWIPKHQAFPKYGSYRRCGWLAQSRPRKFNVGSVRYYHMHATITL